MRDGKSTTKNGFVNLRLTEGWALGTMHNREIIGFTTREDDFSSLLKISLKKLFRKVQRNKMISREEMSSQFRINEIARLFRPKQSLRFPPNLRKSMFRDFTSFQQGFKEWHLSGLTIKALKRKQNVINPERGFVE